MKRKHLIAALLLTVAGMTAHGQAVDTAAMIVDRYLDIMGTSRWGSDSVLALETVITSPSSADTFVMKRWFLSPNMTRVEVWHGKELQTALCSNGTDRFRAYRPKYGQWADLMPGSYYERLLPYDFRGPLHSWRAQGATLTYMGVAKAMGKYDMESVKMEGPGLFTRIYFFEPSGLLSVIVETGELDTAYRAQDEARIEWKIIHEYMEIDGCLLPKQESFMRNGELTVLETTARKEKRNTLIFNQD
jgi:hypothetical protein